MSLRDRNRRQTRAAILQAARLLMTRDGVADTSMMEVAELAGVSDTTVFNYFRTKAELLDAVVGELSSSADLAAVLATRPATEGPFTALRNVVRDRRDGDEVFDAHQAVRLLAAVKSDPALWSSYLRINHDTAETIAELFAERAPEWPPLQARMAAHATVAALSVLLAEITEESTAADLAGQLDTLCAQLERAWP
jgi:AcrR family transcriptional regulator